MNVNQEPKYEFLNGKLINRQSREQIPDDEPIFILRSRDKYAVILLEIYRAIVKIEEHRIAIGRRLQQFKKFAELNASRMKEPDTQLTHQWDTLKP